MLGRFLQGVGAAMLYATQTALVSSVYPAKERGKSNRDNTFCRLFRARCRAVPGWNNHGIFELET